MVKQKGLNVLSLFDGMSCGQIALSKSNINVANYIASEIKKSAIKVTQHNFPSTLQVGSVLDLKYIDGKLFSKDQIVFEGEIDLLIGGSPCQDFSLLKVNGQGLNGDKSRLFYEYLRLLKEINPKYFLLENVKMKKESEIELNNFLNVKGVHINSSLVSFQNRPRIYWSNIPFDIPKDLNINFQDFKETDVEYLKKYKLNITPSRIKMWRNGGGRNGSLSGCANVTFSNKVQCLTRKQDRSPNSGLVEFEDFCRYLTRKELELAQTVPVGYTDIVSYNQAQDLLGDGWTVDVIAHIFRNLKNE